MFFRLPGAPQQPLTALHAAVLQVHSHMNHISTVYDGTCSKVLPKQLQRTVN